MPPRLLDGMNPSSANALPPTKGGAAHPGRRCARGDGALLTGLLRASTACRWMRMTVTPDQIFAATRFPAGWSTPCSWLPAASGPSTAASRPSVGSMLGDEDTLGQARASIQRVGAYIPDGTAPLPSTVLMTVIPALVAGVAHIANHPPRHGATADYRIPQFWSQAAASPASATTIGGGMGYRCAGLRF